MKALEPLGIDFLFFSNLKIFQHLVPCFRTIASLDYEEQKVYKFKVRVSDRGNPSLTSESLARVTINILDENDSPPAFEKESYLAVLLLPTFRDVMVAQINATDPDKGVKTQLR